MLTPKNWGSFQHYKDRSPAWIKLHRGLLDDYTFSRLPVASRALAPLLWLLASEYEGGQIAASTEELSFRLRMTTKELTDALSPLIDAGFFLASEPLAECKPDACLEKEEEKQVEKKDLRAVSDSTSPGFEKFKIEFPKRDGAQGWKPAAKLFDAAVKRGVDEVRIIAGATAYRLECERKGIVKTDKVAQALTWCRQERWDEYQETPPEAVDEFKPDWDAQVARFLKGHPWSTKWYGPEPGQIGCKVPQDVLEKHGVLREDRKIFAA